MSLLNRPPCPYFGFHLTPGLNVMMDQGGNQCALEVGAFHPCDYQVRGAMPDWNVCAIFNKPENERKLTILENVCVVYPELRSEGIRLSDWKKRVLE